MNLSQESGATEEVESWQLKTQMDEDRVSSSLRRIDEMIVEKMMAMMPRSGHMSE